MALSPSRAQAADGTDAPHASKETLTFEAPWTSTEPPRDGTWLTWLAPAACPGRDELLSAIRRHAPESDREPSGVTFEALVQEGPAGFSVRLTVRRAENTGTREVTFATCPEVAEFVTLSIALALDPEAAAEGGGSPASPSVAAGTDGSPGQSYSEAADTPPESADVPRAGAADEGTDRAADTAPGPPSIEPTGNANTLAAEARSARDRGQDVAQTSTKTPEKKPLSWFSTFQAELTTGVLPSATAGVALELGRALGGWQLGFRASLQPGGDFAIAGMPHSVTFRWVGGTLGVCRAFSGDRMSVAVCAKTVGGALLAEEQVPKAAHGGAGSLWGLEADLEADIPVTKRVYAHGATGLLWPLATSTFGFADGTVLYQPSPGFVGSLGARYFF